MPTLNRFESRPNITVEIVEPRKLLSRKRAIIATAAVALCMAAAPESEAAVCAPTKPSTFAYRTVPGVDRNLTSLDVYMPAASCRKGRKPPVVVWVHGGAYQIGDKAKADMPTKAGFFNSQGWALVSINYRLTDMSQPNPWRWPTHYEDGAAALAWVKKNMASKGADPSRIALLGHSAGADLVSNLATQPSYLSKYGLSPRDLRCQGPLDTEGFDKSSLDPNTQWWANALGNAPDWRRTTSATLIARRGVGTPRAIVALRGRYTTVPNSYIAKLAQIGVSGNTAINAQSLTHEEVNSEIGKPGDRVMTPPLLAFLASCLR